MKHKRINHAFLALLMLMLIIAAKSDAQASYDSTFHTTYYDQKLGMFEIMPDQKNEIVWLGDSITDGGEWSELFPNQTTLNRGISGDNTFGVLHRLKEVTSRKPKMVFILIGINDLARGIPVDVIQENYIKIVQQIQAESPSTVIYLQKLLPTNSDFQNFPKHQNKTNGLNHVNGGLEELKGAFGVKLIDLYEAFLDSEGKLDKQYTNDGLHLTGAGYQHWKEIIQASKALK